MKILVVESRSNVFIWDKVFGDDFIENIEVHYLIFNTFFAAKNGINHFISYGECEDSKVEVPIQFDRQRNFFNSPNTKHYGFYEEKISNKLKEINPNLVIGEAASFQDFLTIKACREMGVKHFNPMTSRYPKNRFCFYKEDTLIPFLGSKEEMSKDELNKEFERIVGRRYVPDYMIKKNYRLRLGQRLKDLWIKLQSYYSNDPNTPSPLYFVNRTLKLKTVKKAWIQKSTKTISKNGEGLYVLYPMQMQPESNIDVYGHPYSNQFELIQQIYDNLEEWDVLIIKPNPKPFMELSMEVVDFAEKNDRIILLPFTFPMTEAFKSADLIITVTGTVSIEAILSNKPVGVFKKTYFNTTKNCVQLSSFQDLSPLIEKVRNGNYQPMTEEERKTHLSMLNKVSYQGRISPVNLNAEEVSQIQKSFKSFFDDFREQSFN